MTGFWWVHWQLKRQKTSHSCAKTDCNPNTKQQVDLIKWQLGAVRVMGEGSKMITWFYIKQANEFVEFLSTHSDWKNSGNYEII